MKNKKNKIGSLAIAMLFGTSVSFAQMRSGENAVERELRKAEKAEKTVVTKPEKTVVVKPEKTVVAKPEKTVVVKPEKTVVAKPEKTVVTKPETTKPEKFDPRCKPHDSKPSRMEHTKYCPEKK